LTFLVGLLLAPVRGVRGAFLADLLRRHIRYRNRHCFPTNATAQIMRLCGNLLRKFVFSSFVKHSELLCIASKPALPDREVPPAAFHEPHQARERAQFRIPAETADKTEPSSAGQCLL
jgi:hypothetical protein